MTTPGQDDQTSKTALEKLTERDLAVWSHLHGEGRGSRRGRLEPLNAAEQAEFAPFAETLRRAKAAGFRGDHLVVDNRERGGENLSELKVSRERPGQPTEVIVFLSTKWAHAFRVPAGAPLFGEAELEEEPGRLLDLVLAGAWPEDQQAAAVRAWVEQLTHNGYATTGDRQAVTAEELAAMKAEEPPASWAQWVQSPSDGLWHALRPTGEPPDVETAGVAAVCGHRIPAATQEHAEEEPGFPACMDCTGPLVARLLSSGLSI